MAPDPNEITLAAFRNGDQKSYIKIRQAFEERIHIFLNRKLKDRQVVLEVLQDVFHELWKARARMESNEYIINFLYDTAKDRLINWWKSKEQRQKANTTLVPDFEELITFKQEEIERREIEAGVIQDLMEQVFKAAENLPDQCKRIFLLSKREGKRTKEIALLLNISKSTVSNQIRIALAKIRVILANKGFNALFFFYLLKHLF